MSFCHLVCQPLPPDKNENNAGSSTYNTIEKADMAFTFIFLVGRLDSLCLHEALSKHQRLTLWMAAG